VKHYTKEERRKAKRLAYWAGLMARGEKIETYVNWAQLGCDKNEWCFIDDIKELIDCIHFNEKLRRAKG